VTLNIVTERVYRISGPYEAMVAISSKEHMVQGEPAFARINKMGQTNMEIFNCTNHTMTIEKNSVFGTIVNLEQKEMNQSVNIIEEKKKNILDKV
jgi:hypothetical protein